MQKPKRGNPFRNPRKRKHVALPVAHPQERIRLSLYETDPITDNDETIYTLFYQCYRGYTIYSTEQGRCCIHGLGRRRCLRIGGKFVCFPNIEDAKNLMKHFRSQGILSWESTERYLPEWESVCLNRTEQQCSSMLSRPMQRVS